MVGQQHEEACPNVQTPFASLHICSFVGEGMAAYIHDEPLFQKKKNWTPKMHFKEPLFILEVV